MTVRDKIVDSCDLETFILCKDVEEGKVLGKRLMAECGFDDADVVFAKWGAWSKNQA